jgi:ABC-type phosphate/phosphonate transport system substrate-binding protein
MRAVNARFWEVLRGLLVEAGLRDLPESLTFGRSTARELRDLRGGVFLFNSRHSNSGMNLPRRALADIADGRPFFAKVIETGSHPGNLDRIASGEADATAVDNVTYAFWCHYRPAAARHVRVLGRTPASPAIPFVTSVATAPATVAILRDALTRLGREPHAAAVRADLSITDIVDVPAAAYSRLLEYEREAAELGYPELA